MIRIRLFVLFCFRFFKEITGNPKMGERIARDNTCTVGEIQYKTHASKNNSQASAMLTSTGEPDTAIRPRFVPPNDRRYRRRFLAVEVQSTKPYLFAMSYAIAFSKDDNMPPLSSSSSSDDKEVWIS
jgi:hypothetical protein